MNTKWFTVTNEASADAAEILIYDRIGKDGQDGPGIAAKDFKAALDAIPTDREIHLRINSVGGDVCEGMAIFNLIEERKSHVTCRVDGVAASIASVIACAGKRTIIPKAGIYMLRAPTSTCMGNAAELRRLAEELETYTSVEAAIYSTKSGQPLGQILDMLRAQTWMSGEQATASGFCDECTDEAALTAEARRFDWSQFRNVPALLR